MLHLDEGTIHAWLDGELPPADAENAARHVAGCEECRALVAEARGLMAGATRIVSALDAGPGGVIPRPAGAPGAPRSGPRRRPWYRFALTPVRMSIAATIVVAVGLSLTARRAADNNGSLRSRMVDSPRPTVAMQIDSAASSSTSAAAGAPSAPPASAPAPRSSANVAGFSAPSKPPASPRARKGDLVAEEQKTALADKKNAPVEKQTAAEARMQVASAAPAPAASPAVRFDSVRAKDEMPKVAADSVQRAPAMDAARRRAVPTAVQLSEVVATGARDERPMSGVVSASCYRLEIDSTSWRGILPPAFMLDQKPALLGGVGGAGGGGRGVGAAGAAAPRAAQPANTVLNFSVPARQGSAVRALEASGQAKAAVIGDWIAISADSINVNFTTSGSTKPVAMLIVRAHPNARLTSGDRTDSVRITRTPCQR